ncbi:MAG: hypothetical protein HYR67_00230 [Bacteroidetes bacterium]|nr:hypothetical protein [Bacteroidota bacterium]
MTIRELTYELNADLKVMDTKLSEAICFSEIRNKVSGASKMSNLQILLLVTIVSNKTEFQEKVFIEFIDNAK